MGVFINKKYRPNCAKKKKLSPDMPPAGGPSLAGGGRSIFWRSMHCFSDNRFYKWFLALFGTLVTVILFPALELDNQAQTFKWISTININTHCTHTNEQKKNKHDFINKVARARENLAVQITDIFDISLAPHSKINRIYQGIW